MSEIDETTISKVMSEMGRRGGLKGGKARADKLDDYDKWEIARNAARARWVKAGKVYDDNAPISEDF